MHSRSIQIEKINPAEFFGPNNSNLKHLKTFFPALKISSRGNELTVFGDEETMDEFERKFQLLVRHFNQFNTLKCSELENMEFYIGIFIFFNRYLVEFLVYPG